MRAIYQSGPFASLTYRDIPFVLAPNTWLKFGRVNRKSMPAEPRAHDDGILVDFDSPEALDEVFWRVFAGDSYIRKTRLVPHKVDDEVIEKFRQYIGLINHRYGKNRYLSKNNNNILRIGDIARAFPNARIFVLFRDPLQHAYSLLKQHRNFVRRQTEDDFSRRYMNWLVHHEFGIDHRPFQFSDGDSLEGDSETIDYWLALWSNVYTYLENQAGTFGSNVTLVAYEDICQAGRLAWRELCDRIEIPAVDFDFKLMRTTVPEVSDRGLEDRSMSLYDRLRTRSHQQLGILP